jgi:hypothetical protein
MLHSLKPTFKRFYLAVLFVSLGCFLPSPSLAVDGTWDGTETTKDGVRHVTNPARPIEKPSTFKLNELWRVGGDDDSDDVIFGVLNDMATDGAGNIYLLDSQLNEVLIYSPSGEYLRSIGRAGEGPGEFRMPRALFIAEDNRVAVLQMMPGKIIMLTPDGDAAGNHPTPETDGVMMFTGARPAGNHIVVGTQQWSRQDTEFTITSALIRVSPEGKQTAAYWEKSTPQDMNNRVFDERKLGAAPIWSAAPDGRVFICDDFDAYNIQVRNPDGTPDRVIEREFELRVRSKEEKELRGPQIRLRTSHGDLKTEMIKSKTDRTVLAIYPREDGDVWVLSSRGAFDTADGEIATFDVFNAEGKFVNQVTFLGEGDFDDDGYYFEDDKFFVMVGQTSARRAAEGGRDPQDEELDEAEPMAVICYELGNIVQSKK